MSNNMSNNDDYIRISEKYTIDQVMDAFDNGKVIRIDKPNYHFADLTFHIYMAKIADVFLYCNSSEGSFGAIPYNYEDIKSKIEKNLDYVFIQDEFNNVQFDF